MTIILIYINMRIIFNTTNSKNHRYLSPELATVLYLIDPEKSTGSWGITAIFERRAFRPMDETSVPSMRIVPNTGQKRGERRGERREEGDRSRLEMKESRGEERIGEERKRRDEKLRMVFR